MSSRVLIVLSNSAEAEPLQTALAEWGYEATCARDADDAAVRSAGGMVDAVLWERNPERAKARARLRRLLPEAAWIERVESGDPAIDGFEAGVSDVLVAPIALAELRLALVRAQRIRRLEQQNQRLRAEIEASVGDRPIVAASPAMIHALEATERAATAPGAAFLAGEPGTGREGLARAIHAQGPRRDGPFVAARVASGDAGVRDLFGAVTSQAPMRRGRIASAHGGTLYLERIEALAAAGQVRLLELLSTGSVQALGGEKTLQVDVRVIVSSDHPFASLAEDPGVDPALLEQLLANRIEVPPLRERREDLPLLLDHFIARASQDAAPRQRLTDEALSILLAYDWPGNVAELENVMERAMMLSRGEPISAANLGADLERTQGEAAVPSDLGLRRARRRAEIEIIRRALRQTGGNRTHAAKRLEISHRALLYKLKEYGLKD